MMYPYMTFSDDTEVTHSPLRDNGTVNVYIETPTDTGFKSLTCANCAVDRTVLRSKTDAERSERTP